MSEPFAVNDILEDVDIDKLWVVQATFFGNMELRSLGQSGKLGKRRMNLKPKDYEGYRKIGTWSEAGVRFTR